MRNIGPRQLANSEFPTPFKSSDDRGPPAGATAISQLYAVASIYLSKRTAGTPTKLQRIELSTGRISEDLSIRTAILKAEKPLDANASYSFGRRSTTAAQPFDPVGSLTSPVTPAPSSPAA